MDVKTEIIQTACALFFFVISVFQYYLPALAGSFLNKYLKRAQEHKMSLSDTFVFALVPTIIMVFLEAPLLDRYPELGIVGLFCISFILGLIGDELTIALSTVRNMFRLYQQVKGIADQIHEVMDRVESTADKDDKNDSS